MFEIVIQFILLVIFIGIIVKLYLLYTSGKCNCRTDMSGKVVIITGGNRGIGKETARLLAAKNARVIIGCRNMTSAEQTVQELTDGNNNSLDITAKYLDLSSFESIKNFAKDINRYEKNVSVLICNAATIPSIGKRLNAEGLEEQFAVNHFGHFLLTNLLMDKLIEHGQSRIIVVSSLLHKFGQIDLDNLNMEQNLIGPYEVYWNTKLANILFTRELAKRLSISGHSVTVNACHPGLVQTDIAQELWYWKKVLIPIILPLFGKSLAAGAQTIVHLALSPGLSKVTGKYFTDCHQTMPSDNCFDEILAEKLWLISEKLTRQKFFSSKIK